MKLTWLVLLFGACVQSSEVTCGDGRTCPSGNTCNDDLHTCVSPEQTAACAGLAEQAACVIATVNGVCKGGICQPLLCGDGVRTVPEACDGTDLGDADCTTAGFYEKAGLACTPFCTFDTSACVGTCGDGIVNGGELCDGGPPLGTCVGDGFDAGALRCSHACGADFDGCARFGFVPQQTKLAAVDAFTGRGANDLWAAGGDVDAHVAHFDGQLWSASVAIPQFLPVEIAEAVPGELWLVSLSGDLVHLVGTNPISVAIDAHPLGVFALGDQVYLATSDKGVLRLQGTAWNAVGALATPVAHVRGSAADDLWALGTDGSLSHWNGVTWTATPLAAAISDLDALAPDDAWAIGLANNKLVVARWDGAAWVVTPATAKFQASSLAAFADNDVWVALSGGSIMHFDGIAWTDSLNDVTAQKEHGLGFIGLTKLGAGQLAAATRDGYAYRYSGQVYGGSASGSTNISRLLWGSGETDLHSGDVAGRLLHFDGKGWTVVATVANAVTALTGSGPHDAWAAGADGTIYHWDGTAWAGVVSANGAVTGMWASGPTDLWVAYVGTVEHWNGVALDASLSAENQFCSVDGSGAANVWAACGEAAYHWNGTTWSDAIAIPTSEQVVALRVVGPDNVLFISGNHVLHLDGTAWTDTQLLAFSNLTLIHSSAPDDIFVASKRELFHFDGATWTPVATPRDAAGTNADLDALFVQPGVVELIVGSLGADHRRLIRPRPWDCRAKETGCNDGVDDDCDGLVDARDPDCH